ncbi:hypothetical protein DFH09DRAFT_1098592 [Mycena vulgaris]|nr:hypothetical protein DFH09DRAFT_1098592 [Mycena vulgaris]
MSDCVRRLSSQDPARSHFRRRLRRSRGGPILRLVHSLPGLHKLAPQFAIQLTGSRAQYLRQPLLCRSHRSTTGRSFVGLDLQRRRDRLLLEHVRRSSSSLDAIPGLRTPPPRAILRSSRALEPLQRLRSNASLSLPALQTGSAFRRPHQTGSPRGRQINSVVYDPTLPFARLRFSQSPSSGMPVPATRPPSFYDTALAASDARQLFKKRKKVDVLHSRVAASAHFFLLSLCTNDFTPK